LNVSSIVFYIFGEGGYATHLFLIIMKQSTDQLLVSSIQLMNTKCIYKTHF